MKLMTGYFKYVIAILAIIGIYAGEAFFAKPRTQGTIPQNPINHLGVIMDGNRRWAKSHGLASFRGHKKGVDGVKATIRFCLDYQIPYLTLYAFSLENFKRPQQELDYLFNVLAQEIASNELDELFKEGVRVRFIGDRTLFPVQLVPIIDDIETKTHNNTRLNLSILFCYGGRQEIVAGVQQIAREVQSGTLIPDAITTSTIEKSLWIGDIPSPDLIIRTGGMKRLSNFLLFGAAYSELYFLDCFWPEITKDHLIDAIQEYMNRKRNYGA